MDLYLSVAYFSTQEKSASPGKEKSKLKVLLMHVECCGLADYKRDTQRVIFYFEERSRMETFCEE